MIQVKILREKDLALEVTIPEIEKDIIDQGLIVEIESIDNLHEDIEMIALIQGTVTIEKGLDLMRDTGETTDQGLDLKKTEEEGNLQRNKYLLSLAIFIKAES